MLLPIKITAWLYSTGEHNKGVRCKFWCNHNIGWKHPMYIFFPYSLAPPLDGLYFMVNSTVYLPGGTIPITDVGDGFPGTTNPTDPGPSLVCVTTNVNTMCCRGSDHPGSGSVGNWFYPDDTIVLGNNDDPNGDITRSSHAQQIRLNRKRPDVMSPTGVYTCVVPDVSDTAIIHRATISLSDGECMIILCVIL